MPTPRKGGRVVECAGLEIRCTVLPYRGFESHPFRQNSPVDFPKPSIVMAFSSVNQYVAWGQGCICVNTRDRWLTPIDNLAGVIWGQ
ncbi:hypothetical protein THIX_70100 [Thiomonas sp. X19]|nr:hypothetical protein THIX_70100 [Thiomonas sp. X19]